MKNSLTGKDTIKIDDYLVTEGGDGDVGSITFPNDIANVKTGKNGNSIFAINESGKQSEVMLRVMLGGNDDKYLNNRMAQQDNDFASFVLLDGEFTKRVGDGAGNITEVKYINSGGIFNKRVEAKSNVEGDTEQSLAIYHIKFTNSPRVIT